MGPQFPWKQQLRQELGVKPLLGCSSGAGRGNFSLKAEKWGSLGALEEHFLDIFLPFSRDLGRIWSIQAGAAALGHKWSMSCPGWAWPGSFSAQIQGKMVQIKRDQHQASKCISQVRILFFSRINREEKEWRFRQIRDNHPEFPHGLTWNGAGTVRGVPGHGWALRPLPPQSIPRLFGNVICLQSATFSTNVTGPGGFFREYFPSFPSPDQERWNQPVLGQHGPQGERKSGIFQLPRHGREPGK